jgi:hypothetical protein
MKSDLPSQEELAAITARGRIMAEYDVAAWHATDVVQDLKPEKGSTRYYIAKKLDAGWVVVFGRLNEAHDRFLTVYQANQGHSRSFSRPRNTNRRRRARISTFLPQRRLKAH